MKRIFTSTLVVVILAIAIVFAMRSSSGNKVFIRHDIIIRNVEKLGKLEVAKFTVRDIVEYSEGRKILPDSKTVLIVTGEIVGCIDMTKISPDDVCVEGDSISLILPVPELCHCKIDHSRSRVYNVEYGFRNTAKLVDDAYRAAETQLYAEALNMGIVAESKKNADIILRPMLEMMGFKRIDISFREPAGIKTIFKSIPEMPVFKHIDTSSR